MSDDGVRDEPLARLEALLFAAEEPLSARKLSSLLDQPPAEVERMLTRLDSAYARDGSAFVLQEAGGGFQLRTRPDLWNQLSDWRQGQEDAPLSAPLLHTLAIVAYRQPINRADIELLRGSAAGEILRQLTDLGWIKVVGREETLGRPQLYGTTRQFLQEFALRNLGELPQVEGLEKSIPKVALASTPESDESQS